MSKAWQRVHNRSAVLREVVTELEHSRSDALPWNRTIAAVFADPSDLLVTLHGMWLRRLLTRLDMALEMGEDDLAESVAAARDQLASEMRGVRRALDRYADDPALERCITNERRLLAGLGVPLDRPAERVTEPRRAGHRSWQPWRPRRRCARAGLRPAPR